MKLRNQRLLTKLVAIALLFAGCEQRHGTEAEQVTLQERILSHPNPTSYEFDAALGDVKEAIKTGYDKWREEQRKKYREKVWKGAGDTKSKHLLTLALQLSGLTQLLWKGDGDSLAKGILSKPGNENDAYIYGGDTPVGESEVYFKDGQPLIYYADFHVHLTAASPKMTRVEIHTHDSNVVTGVNESWSPHGTSFTSVKVEATTIEEYEILVGIGEQLGAKGMPPLAVPGPDAPVKQLKLSRER
jgi:hypothetical protein